MNTTAESKKVTAEKLLERFDKETHDAIRASLELYGDAIGVMLFTNHDLSNRGIGSPVIFPFGPSNTIRELSQLPENGVCPMDLSSLGKRAWQFYFDCWCSRDEVYAAVGGKTSR